MFKRNAHVCVLGTARFTKEPVVQNINNVDIKKLSEDLWMSDQSTVIFGSNMSLQSMIIDERVIITVRISSRID